MKSAEERRVYIREYMREWCKRPEGRASYTASARKYRSRPDIKARLAAKKRVKNATPEGKLQQRVRVLKFHYGITREQYETMLLAQNGCCAICHSPPPTNGRYKNLCVDHCHSTGAVRGLLCGKCNQAIGLLGDNPEVASRASTYLGRGSP